MTGDRERTFWIGVHVAGIVAMLALIAAVVAWLAGAWRIWGLSWSLSLAAGAFAGAALMVRSLRR